MTSFTKALYRRDPAAAEAFHEQQKFEHRIKYGRTPTLVQFTAAFHAVQPVFGRRGPSLPSQHACAASCGHPACKDGCTLIGRMD